jgi:hypothetical protein
MFNNQVNLVPLLGSGFNLFSPLLLLILTVLTALRRFSKVLVFLRISGPQDMDPNDATDHDIIEGRLYVARERARKKRAQNQERNDDSVASRFSKESPMSRPTDDRGLSRPTKEGKALELGTSLQPKEIFLEDSELSITRLDDMIDKGNTSPFEQKIVKMQTEKLQFKSLMDKRTQQAKSARNFRN